MIDEKKELPKEIKKAPEVKVSKMEAIKKRIDSFKESDGKEKFKTLLRDIKTAQGIGKERKPLNKEYVEKYEKFYAWLLDKK